MTTPLNMRRLGIVKYTQEFISDCGYLLYQYFVPFYMSYDPLDCTFTVKGVSERFREVPLGERIPSYKALITRTPKNGSKPELGYDYSFQFNEVIEDAALH